MKLNENLRPLVLEKAGAGQSSQAIADWLLAEHGVSITSRGVRDFLAKVARERAPIAQAIVREKLSSTLTSDLDAVDQLLARARAIENAARPKPELIAEAELIALSNAADLFDENGAPRPLKDLTKEQQRIIAGLEVESIFQSRGGAHLDDGDGEVTTESAGRIVKLKVWDKIAALKLALAERNNTAASTIALAAIDRQLRALELRFKLSGANPDEPNKPAGVILLPPETPDE